MRRRESEGRGGMGRLLCAHDIAKKKIRMEQDLRIDVRMDRIIIVVIQRRVQES
jgi:hypothetical protein